MTDKTSLGDRMKGFEAIPRIFLTPRMPMVLRVDGRAFHTYTRRFKRPWDLRIRDAMTAVAESLMKEMQGAKIAYVQSDEVSVICTDYDKLTSSAWFDKNVQKCTSVSASIATAAFNQAMSQMSADTDKQALFDARVFVLPKEEICNYLIWRQQDAIRNSISMLAQKHFSHKQLHGQSSGAKKEKLMTEKGIDWESFEVWQKRGWCVTRQTIILTVAELEQQGGTISKKPGIVIPPDTEVRRTRIGPDWETPEFSQNRDYVEHHVSVTTDEQVHTPA